MSSNTRRRATNKDILELYGYVQKWDYNDGKSMMVLLSYNDTAGNPHAAINTNKDHDDNYFINNLYDELSNKMYAAVDDIERENLGG